jgi:hypothetical protein
MNGTFPLNQLQAATVLARVHFEILLAKSDCNPDRIVVGFESFKLIRRYSTMSRSLVTEKPITPPKELAALFNDPPLVGNERREDYENLFLAIARAVKPADAIEWIMSRHVADLSWEIGRERRVKAEIIGLKQREVLLESSCRLSRVDFLREQVIATAEAESPSMFKKKDEFKPEAKEKDHASGLPEAYILGNRDIDLIDTRIASYEYRRNAALREINAYSEAMARRVDKVSRDVIDGEFTEAAE